MFTERTVHLLAEAARAFDDERDPFSHAWLSEHRVTADEASSLSNLLGLIIAGFIASPTRAQRAVIITGITQLVATNLPAVVVESIATELESTGGTRP